MTKLIETSLEARDIVENRLLESHVHFLTGDITEENIRKALQWLVYENLTKTPKNLTLYINSPGGDLYQGFALIDAMRASKHPVHTIGLGQVCSAAFLIFVSGAKKYRKIAANTGIMCHQYSDSPEGKHHDLKAQMKEGEHCNNRMLAILQSACKLDAKTITRKLLNPTDVWLTAEELVELGLADKIL